MQKQRSKRGREDFDKELRGKRVRLILQSGEELEAEVTGSSRYWLKLQVKTRDGKDKTLYLNKAYIMLIEPAELE